MQAWAERLAPLGPQLQGAGGHIHFLWGTDWEDAPLVNAAALDRALPPAMRWDQRRAVAAEAASRPHTIMSMLARMPRRAPASTEDASKPGQSLGSGRSAAGDVDAQEQEQVVNGGVAGQPPGGPSDPDPEAGPSGCSDGVTPDAKRRCLLAPRSEWGVSQGEQAGAPPVSGAQTGGGGRQEQQQGGAGKPVSGSQASRSGTSGTQRKLQQYFTAKPAAAGKQAPSWDRTG
jgi:hypothetical protein